MQGVCPDTIRNRSPKSNGRRGGCDTGKSPQIQARAKQPRMIPRKNPQKKAPARAKKPAPKQCAGHAIPHQLVVTPEEISPTSLGGPFKADVLEHGKPDMQSHLVNAIYLFVFCSSILSISFIHFESFVSRFVCTKLTVLFVCIDTFCRNIHMYKSIKLCSYHCTSLDSNKGIEISTPLK